MMTEKKKKKKKMQAMNHICIVRQLSVISIAKKNNNNNFLTFPIVALKLLNITTTTKTTMTMTEKYQKFNLVYCCWSCLINCKRLMINVKIFFITQGKKKKRRKVWLSLDSRMRLQAWESKASGKVKAAHNCGNNLPFTTVNNALIFNIGQPTVVCCSPVYNQHL